MAMDMILLLGALPGFVVFEELITLSYDVLVRFAAQFADQMEWHVGSVE